MQIVGNALAQSDQGKAAIEAIQNGVEAWGQYEKDNPNTASVIKSFGDVVNFATTFGTGGAGVTTLKSAEQFGKAEAKQLVKSGAEFAAEAAKVIAPALRTSRELGTEALETIGRGGKKIKEFKEKK